MEMMSLVIGTGTTIAWWYSMANIILNDLLCVCISIACIKILKFTSLKIPLLSFIIITVLEVGFELILYTIEDINYSNLFLNKFNCPFQFQMPSITLVFKQKCSWLPFTVIVFPGMLISYLRRFDSGRGTTLYLITAIATFFIGTLVWTLLTLKSTLVISFGLISGSCMFTLLIVFAHRRRELRVLWDGKFYDEEFVDRLDLNFALKMIELQTIRASAKTIDSRILEDLKQKDDAFRNSDSSTIRSKFLKWRVGSDLNEIDRRERGPRGSKTHNDIKGHIGGPRDEESSR